MRYFIGFLAVVIFVVAIFILVLRGFRGPDQPAEAPLTDYTSTNIMMRYTVDGPINNEESHRKVRITVSRSESRIELIQGYQENVILAKSYVSNEEAYGTFLRTLDLLNFTEGDKNPEKADERGVCPTDNRFVYEIVNGTDKLQRYWKGSCGGGTFGGNANLVRAAFIQQIPDYTAIAGNSGL